MRYESTLRRPTTQDLTNQSFGPWTVLGFAGYGGKRIYWTCQCVCGTIRDVETYLLRRQNSAVRDCTGCTIRGRIRKYHFPQPGQPFGQLTIIEEVPVPLRWQKTYRAKYHWYSCQCSCGKETILPDNALHSDNTRSCGCLQREAAKRTGTQKGTHRESGLDGVREKSKEYKAWVGMKQRCLNPKTTRYISWGGRGITVCSQWLTSYETFLADVGRAPSPQHSLDRYPDNNGPYEPGNVRWATPAEQRLNSRQNRYITFRNETLTLGQWAQRIGIHSSSLAERLQSDCSLEQALTMPRGQFHRSS